MSSSLLALQNQGYKLCPAGKELMHPLTEMICRGRADLALLLTHTFSLDEITEGYKLFGARRDGVLKGGD